MGTGPGLVLFEDFHWYDEDTIEIVEALLRESRRGLLVVITGRDVPPLDGTAQLVDVKPLTDTEAEALIRALHPELKPRARKAVQERCDGIPLYIEEVVAKLKGQPDDAGDTAEVPDTLYETLVARVRSSPNTLSVVEAAAMIGSRFDRNLLSSVVALDEQEVDNQLEKLTRDRVLQPVGKRHWRFHHELLREVAAELSPPSVQHSLHQRIADALVAGTADGTPEWPLVASHYASAEKFAEAASGYQEAAANARQRGALNEARNHLARALDNIAQLPEGPARDKHEVAVRLERGFLASAATGHASSEAAAEFERCLQLIGDEPSLELYATFSAMWSYYATIGDLRRATQLVEALRLRLSDMPDWYRAANDAVVGSLAVFRGEFHNARAILEAAADSVEEIGAPEIEGTWFAPNDPVAGMYTFVAFTRFIQGDLIGAEAAFAQMEQRCASLPFPHGPFTLCYGRVIEALIRSETGQSVRAVHCVNELADIGQRCGFDEWVMLAQSAGVNAQTRRWLADVHDRSDELEAYIQALTMVVETWRAAGLKSFLCWYDAALALALLAADRKEAARKRVDLALQMAEETDWHIYDAELYRIRAHTHDIPDDSDADFRTAIELAQKQGAWVFELRAAADVFTIHGEPQRTAVVNAMSHFTADQDWPELARIRALLG